MTNTPVPGERNTYLANEALRVIGTTATTRGELRSHLRQANQRANHPPLKVKEVDAIANSVWRNRHGEDAERDADIEDAESTITYKDELPTDEDEYRRLYMGAGDVDLYKAPDPLGKLNNPDEEAERLDREIEEGRKGLIPQSPQEQRAVQSMQSSQHAWHALQVERVKQISKGYTPDHDDALDLDELIDTIRDNVIKAARGEREGDVNRTCDADTVRFHLIRAGALIAATLASMERRGL